MAASNKHPNDGNDDPVLVAAMAVVGPILFFMAVWFIAHEQIAWTFLTIFEHVAAMWHWAPWIQTEERYQKMEAFTVFVSSVDERELTFVQLSRIGNLAMTNLVPIVILLMALMAWHAWTASPTVAFHNVMDFKTLVRRLNPFFPASTPVIGLDLINTDPDKGPWRRMETYIGFALKHKLLSTAKGRLIEKLGEDETAWSYDIDAAKEVFAKQLGPKTLNVWKSLPTKAPHYASLAAIFAARINGAFDDSNDALDALAASCKRNTKTGEYRINTDLTKSLWEAHAFTKEVLTIVSRHHFINTAMYALLEEARQRSGVLQPAWFLWLKPVDRRLWYSLHQVGLRVGNIEAGGVRAHVLAEKRNQAAIPTPYVEQAALALREHLSDEGWINTQSSDYSPAETFEAEEEGDFLDQAETVA